MGFKKMSEYNEERYGGFFMLRNNGDAADVIFLYQSKDDVLVADVHYIKSADYSGYTHCLGRNCPACGNKIRVQNKLFIPLYNITSGEIEFWDRSTRFENQLVTDVFDKFPNPSEYVFRITRNGAAGDVNTTYSIVAVGRNDMMSYHEILASKKVMLPDYYDTICKEMSQSEMINILSPQNNSYSNSTSSNDASSLPNYVLGERRPPASTGSDTPVVSQIPNLTDIPDVPSMDDDTLEDMSNMDIDEDPNF